MNQENRRAFVRIFIVAFCLFLNSASSMYIYSFLPFMMVDFGMTESTTHSGKYASWMASGYFFARFITSSLWGAAIDKYGRKKGLLACLISVTFLSILFGFSQNYWTAFGIRILTGLLNGLSVIGKVLTTEVCSEELKPWAISIISTIWSLGMTTGPFIGTVFYGWIEGWPYLSSSLAVAILGLTLTILTFIYIEETLILKPTKYELVEKSDEEENRRDIELNTISEIPETKPKPIAFDKLSKIDQIKRLFLLPNVTKLIFIFGINTFYAATLGELIPFWAAAEYQDGGLSFNYKDISDIFIYLAFPQLFIQLFLYPFIQKKKGDFWLLSNGHWAHLPMYILLPLAHRLPQTQTGYMKLWIIFFMFIRNFASFLNFSSLQRFTNDTISAEKRGKINGFQVTFSSLLQSLGPFIGGWVLAWSMEPGHFFPFDYHFVFYLMFGITLYTLHVVYNLEFHDKERKKIKGERDSSHVNM
jgi:MFS family permease